jgi:predicted nucleic acid-binding Zn ribbon protein
MTALVCAFCGLPLTYGLWQGKRYHGKVCFDRHYDQLATRSQLASVAAAERRIRRKGGGIPVAPRERSGRPPAIAALPPVRWCSWCGNTLGPDHRGKFCSDQCDMDQRADEWRRSRRRHPLAAGAS